MRSVCVYSISVHSSVVFKTEMCQSLYKING